MSPRQQTRASRHALRESLLEDCRAGRLRAGEALPPLRNLAGKHDLSLATAQRVLRELADEGILELRQGVGAFVGRLPDQGERVFAAVFGANFSDSHPHLRAARDGFEAEISRRGATALTLTPYTRGLPSVLEASRNGELEIGGAFFFRPPAESNTVQGKEIEAALQGPRLCYIDDIRHSIENSDSIHFDDHDGARQAVSHLWQRGYREIAFLALHGAQTPLADYAWSRRREAGFRAAMAALNLESHVFHPANAPLQTTNDQIPFGRDAATSLLSLLQRGEVKAVVCVNNGAMEGLVEAARAAHLPEIHWPALIAFDDISSDEHLLSVMRLPWDELGRVAAETLWNRAFGTPAQRTAPPREIEVPMRLVNRLSSRPKARIPNGGGVFALAL